MEAKELRLKTPEELRRQAAELYGKIREARFQAATRQLRNHRGLRALKRELARIETVLAALTATQS